MTVEEMKFEVACKEQRLRTLESRGKKNFDCPGVRRKVNREIRNLNRKIAEVEND